MLRAMMTVSGFTLVSRLLGFLRDMLMMQLLGVSKVTDAFFAAFRFPNMFRRIFGEGAYNAAFVPLFGKKLEEEGHEAAVGFARNTFSSLFVVLGVLTMVAIPCMHWIMALVVPGFLPKFESNLGYVGAGMSHPTLEVNTRGAREVYFQVKSKSEEAVAHWSERVEFYSARVVAEGGEEEPLFPGKEGFEIEGMSLGEEGSYRIDSAGWVRIKFPDDHRYQKLKGQFEIGPSAEGEEVRKASLLVYRNHPGTFQLTVQLSRIMFCYLLFMALAAHLSGVLNTFKIFGMPAAAPIILNVTLLVALTLIWQLGYLPGATLAWAVAVAGFLQFGALWLSCARNKALMLVRKPVLDSDLKRLLILMGPGVAAAGIQQVNLLVGGIIASFQEGAISFVYVADRIYQLPLGMIGIALGVVLLPEVTRRLRSGREHEASESILKGVELGMLLTVPAAVAMLVIPVEIVSALFERGKFDAEDAQKTGWALAGFALGLPGYVLIKVLQPGYFAREDTKSPMAMGGVAVAVNIVCSIVLFSLLRPTGYGHVGIAIATSLSAWVNVLLLWRGLRGFVKIRKRDRRKLIRIGIASLLMGGVVWLAARGLAPWFDGGTWFKIGALALVVGTGASFYGFLALVLRATSVAELKEGFGKG